MINETASFLQYGALGLLGIFMLGLYLLLVRVVDRFCRSMDAMSAALVAINGDLKAAHADVKRVVDVIAQAQGHVALVAVKGGPNA